MKLYLSEPSRALSATANPLLSERSSLDSLEPVFWEVNFYCTLTRRAECNTFLTENVSSRGNRFSARRKRKLGWPSKTQLP